RGEESGAGEGNVEDAASPPGGCCCEIDRGPRYLAANESPTAVSKSRRLNGFRAGHIARDEDHPLRQRGCRGFQLPVKRFPIEPRHLEIADDEIVRPA